MDEAKSQMLLPRRSQTGIHNRPSVQKCSNTHQGRRSRPRNGILPSPVQNTPRTRRTIWTLYLRIKVRYPLGLLPDGPITSRRIHVSLSSRQIDRTTIRIDRRFRLLCRTNIIRRSFLRQRRLHDRSRLHLHGIHPPPQIGLLFSRTKMIEYPLPQVGLRPYFPKAVETPFGWLVELRYYGQTTSIDAQPRSGVQWLGLDGKFSKALFESNLEERLHIYSVVNIETQSGAVVYLKNDGTFSREYRGDSDLWRNSRSHLGCHIIKNIYQHSADNSHKSFSHTNKENMIDSVLVWTFNMKKQGLLVANPRTKEFKIVEIESGDFINNAFMGIDTILICTEKTFVFLDIPIEK